MGYTFDEFWFEIPMDRLFAELAWVTENDAIHRAFGGIKRDGLGYVGQGGKQLMELVK
jgi:hypothetical protein